MTSDTAGKELPILIVEDSLPDYQSMLRVFRKLELTNPVFHCETGQDALNFLNHAGGYAAPGAAPRPAVILLDLNLPGTDGRTILRQIKNDGNLKSIPVVVFTTSDSDRDVNECYQNGANGYITKPVGLEKLLDVFRAFKSYWLETVLLPAA